MAKRMAGLAASTIPRCPARAATDWDWGRAIAQAIAGAGINVTFLVAQVGGLDEPRPNRREVFGGASEASPRQRRASPTLRKGGQAGRRNTPGVYAMSAAKIPRTTTTGLSYGDDDARSCRPCLRRPGRKGRRGMTVQGRKTGDRWLRV